MAYANTNFTHVKTGLTLGGKPIIIDRQGRFQVAGRDDLVNGTIEGLRQDYEAALVEAEAKKAKAKEKAKMQASGLPVHVLKRDTISPATLRGRSERDSGYLLTVDGKKVNSRKDYYTVLRLLTDDEVAEFKALRADVDAIDKQVNDLWAKGTMVSGMDTNTTMTTDESGRATGWTVKVVLDSTRYSKDPKQPEPVAVETVEFNGQEFVATTLGVSSDRLYDLDKKILAVVHPDHGAEVIAQDGTIFTYDSGKSYSRGVRTDTFDEREYSRLLAEAKEAHTALDTWVTAHVYQG